MQYRTGLKHGNADSPLQRPRADFGCKYCGMTEVAIVDLKMFMVTLRTPLTKKPLVLRADLVEDELTHVVWI